MIRLSALLAALTLATPLAAETLRVATFDVGLGRDGPGLLLHELRTAPKPDALAVAAVIRAADPDILLLTGFDHDAGGQALDAFRALLAEGGAIAGYPHAFAAAGNSGVPSGRDLDGDGRTAGPRDAIGWGRFPGQDGMAILSRLPIDADAVRSFTTLPWTALPDADPPERARAAGLRLSSKAHWDVPLALPSGRRLHLLAAAPTPPLFDGPDGMNRRRNRDEIRLWSLYLGGTPLPDDQGRTAPAADAPAVLVGNLNLDPRDGAGERSAIAALLGHPRLQDPLPASPGAEAAAGSGANGGHDGDPRHDTADFDDDGDGPGNLRLDYVLPSRDLPVEAAGVVWPAPGTQLADESAAASRHRLVWVDLALP